MIIIPTIPHTGTRFTENLFIQQGYSSAAMNEEISDSRTKVIRVGHISIGQRPHILKHIFSNIAVIPLRHPYLTAESWRRREKPLEEMCYAYRLLVNELDSFDPLYLPIDTPDREYYLNEISDFLGVNLATEWEVKNSHHDTSRLHWQDLPQEGIVQELVTEIQPLLDRFY